jgi:murein DD-endopeptidase MepM/ murein hydrolase activator NlpD
MRFFKTAVSMTVLCAALGGCADLTPRPQYPISQPPAPAPAPPPVAAAPVSAPADPDAPRAAPTQPIEQKSLAPPPGAKTAPSRGSTLEPRDEGDNAVAFAAASKAKTVTVGKGDTLAKIAKAHGVSVEDLAKANDLPSPYRLSIGQTLTLPGAGPERVSRTKPEAAEKPESKSQPAKSDAGKSVTVGQGDTLAKISRDTGVSVEDLAKANGLEPPYRLHIGQTLALSAAAAPASGSTKGGPRKAEPQPEPEPAPQTVTVSKGDTLQSISRKSRVAVADLAKLNHLKKPYHLRKGQTIRLSAGEEQAAAPAPEPAKAPSPTSVVAGKHDTLRGIADKAGVPVADLARLNHLKKPYRLKRGQVIRLPGHAEASAPAASYTVKKGDTLYSIARQFGTDPQSLAEANGLNTDARLSVGRKLQLPGGPLDKPVKRPARTETPPLDDTPAPPRAPRTPSPPEPSQPVPYSSLPANPSTQPAPGLAPPPPSTYRPAPPEAAAPATSDADVAAAGRGFFIWPMRGRILSGYGPKTGGQRNDGVDIAASTGDPVRSAAAGEVIYAGNSVPGFGNLILIRHEGGWVTTYAHLANIDVKMRQMVTQGQQIGEAGQTGGVDQPQLHFEVRYTPNLKDRARPIDPMLVLPQ